MANDVHSFEQIDGSNFNNQDRVLGAVRINVPSPAAGTAGTAVTVTVSFPVGVLPNNYSVQVTPSVLCLVAVTNKTNNSFQVTLSPSVATVTLAAGTFDVTLQG